MPRADGRIEPGQKLTTAISARAWNRAQQAADIVLGTNPGNAAEPIAGLSSPYTWVYGKNTSGTNASRWAVLTITGVEITPTANDADAATRQFCTMPALTLGADTETGQRCVAIEPIAAGKIGRVAIAGAVQVKAADVDKLEGVTELWKDANWALVRFGGGGGVRVGKVADAWAIGTCATVTLWERTGTSCAPAEKDPAETVENVANLSWDIPADSWVLIGQAADGKWYVVESGIEGSCRKTIGGEDITKWTGWDGAKQQLLGHDENGCLKWFDVEQCSTGGTA